MLASAGAWSQAPLYKSNVRHKRIPVKDNIQVDSSSIVPNNFSVEGVPSSMYTLDPVNAVLHWNSKPLQDSVNVTYRVFGFRLNTAVRKYSYDSVRYNFALEPVKTKGETDEKLFDFGNMNYSGSFGRGLSFGNNQDAVVNSSMNLQINGYIADSIELTAAVSDNNIPIQPEGNTQNLRDFDKIYMQVKKNNWQANFGDIDIRQSKNYFLNFYKRLQGASVIVDNRFGRYSNNSLLASGAIAKGKFTRDIITPVEGNQGPYRLTTPNRELYVVVLASTERVYLDGQLLSRGDDQDYVIDYNTAELRFTPKHLITKDSRIQVEFEYSDRNYLTSQLYVNDEVKVNNRLKLSLGMYSNVDAKNSPINQVLDSKQKTFLASIGDKIESATYPNAVPDTFSTGKILYKKVDTVYNSIHDSVFVYAPFKADQVYSVSFLFVGEGKGDYVPDQGNANGRVYKWVQPLNGVKQGQWQPVVLLITPKKHQLFSAAADYQLTASTSVRSEVAMSNYDVNTFSAKDKSNDKGGAIRLQVDNSSKVLQSWHSGLRLQSNFGYEYVEDRFKPIERLRNIEFKRDWILPFDAPDATETLVSGGLHLTDGKNNGLSYEVTNYKRSDHYNGFRHSVVNIMDVGGFRFDNRLKLTRVSMTDQEGVFVRPSMDISRKISWLKNTRIGGQVYAENNKLRNTRYDTLMPLSFSFTNWTGYVNSPEERVNKWGASYTIRNTKYPIKKQLQLSDRSENINLFSDFLSNEHQQFRVNVTYRKLKIFNQAITTQKPEESFIGRLEYAVNKWKGFVNGNALYEVGSGQEQKREYTYVQVPAGQGEYTWVDYNNNGIPELNEFELAVYPDQRKYIRIFSPTNDYVKANYVILNYALDLNPRSLFPQEKKTGLPAFVSRFSSNSSLQINRKVIAHGAILFNPFEQKTADTALISLSSFLSNTLFFNRNSIKWGMDVSHRLNNSRSLLTYGFETKKLEDVTTHARWNINSSFSAVLTDRFINNQLSTVKFANRNYDIGQRTIEPSISYTYRSNFRFTLQYTNDYRNNRIGFEKAKNNAVIADVKYSLLSSGSITGRFTYNNIDYTGETNSTVGYTMLDGLLPGKNYLWNIQLLKKLGGNLEMELQYDARKSGTTKTINTGHASLRALF
jgi:hypothetical protein